MKNDYCSLTQEEIALLPDRFKGFLLSPFQHNLKGGYVLVPEDSFKDMIAVISEYAGKEAVGTAAGGAVTEVKIGEVVARQEGGVP